MSRLLILILLAMPSILTSCKIDCANLPTQVFVLPIAVDPINPVTGSKSDPNEKSAYQYYAEDLEREIERLRNESGCFCPSYKSVW